MISFDVTVMVNTMELKANVSGIRYDLSYIDRNSATFTSFPAQNLRTNNMTSGSDYVAIISVQPAMYVTALKITITGSRSNQVNSVIHTVVVMGCPSAVFETGSNDTTDLEWKIGLSDNNIQTYPFLSVVTDTDSENNIEDILKNLDKPKMDSATYNVPVGNSACAYTSSEIKSSLESDNDLAAVRFDNVRVSRKSGSVEVRVDITALNKKEYDAAMLYLRSGVTRAVHAVQCGSDQISLALTNADSSVTTPTIVAIVFGLILLLVIAFAIGCVVFRLRRRKHAAPGSTSMSHLH